MPTNISIVTTVCAAIPPHRSHVSGPNAKSGRIRDACVLPCSQSVQRSGKTLVFLKQPLCNDIAMHLIFDSFNPWWRLGRVPQSLTGRLGQTFLALKRSLSNRQRTMVLGLTQAGKTTLFSNQIDRPIRERIISPTTSFLLFARRGALKSGKKLQLLFRPIFYKRP